MTPVDRAVTGSPAERSASGEATGHDGHVIPCDRCGAPARVHVLAGYADGRPIGRHFCHACADVAYELHLGAEAGPGRPRPRVSSLIIVVGVVFAVLGTSFDLFGVKGAAGFGWQQQGGVAAGVLLVILGGLLRVDALAIGGALLFGAAVLADVYGTLGSPGIGLKQQLLVAAGVLLIFAGVWLRRRKKHKHPAGAD
jgi:hypothetical protein